MAIISAILERGDDEYHLQPSRVSRLEDHYSEPSLLPSGYASRPIDTGNQCQSHGRSDILSALF